MTQINQPIISSNMNVGLANPSQDLFSASNHEAGLLFGSEMIGGAEDTYTSDFFKNQIKTKALDLLAQSKKVRKDSEGNVDKASQKTLNKRIKDLKEQAEKAGVDLSEIFSEIVNDSNMTRKQIKHIQKTFGVSISNPSAESISDESSSISQRNKMNPFGSMSRGFGSTTLSSSQYSYQKTYSRTPSVKLDKAFLDKTKGIADRIGCDYKDLLAVMNSESGLRSDARNPKGGATGLIQFMPDTARSLGTTVDELRNMSPIEQLDYVEKFLTNTKKSAGFASGARLSGGDLYALIFMPARAKRDVLTSASDGKTYSWNRGLDRDNDGHISKADLERRVASSYVDESKVFA